VTSTIQLARIALMGLLATLPAAPHADESDGGAEVTVGVVR
jgi:hypothetical protein